MHNYNMSDEELINLMALTCLLSPIQPASTPSLRYKCPECNKEIQSLSRRHLDQCECSNKAFVDGGGDRTRIGWKTSRPVPVKE